MKLHTLRYSGALPVLLIGIARSPVITFIVWALVFGLVLFDSSALLRAVHGNPGWVGTTDFGVYVRAATAVADGHNPYDPALYPPSLFGNVPTHDFYSYPPFFAELLAPFVAVSPSMARLLWTLTSIGCLALSLTILLRGFGNQVGWKWVALILAFAFSTGLVRNDLYHGEVNFALLLLFTLGLHYFIGRRMRLSGICWGLLVVVKPFLAIVVLYLLWKREWQAAVTSVLFSGFLSLFSLVILWPSSFSSLKGWLQIVAYDGSLVYSGRPDNYSIHGLLLRLFSTNPYTTPWLTNDLIFQVATLSLIAILVLAFVWSVPSLPGRGLGRQVSIVLVEASLPLALSLAYGPVTEGDHLFLLLPMFVGVLSITLRAGLERWSSRRYWYATASGWSLLFALRAPPVILNPGLKMGTSWQSVGGITILWTGLLGGIVLVSALLTALALRQGHERLLTGPVRGPDIIPGKFHAKGSEQNNLNT